MWPEISPLWEFAAIVFFAWIWGSFLNQCVDRIGIRRAVQMQFSRPSGDSPARGESGPSGARSNEPDSAPLPTEPRIESMLQPARSVCFGCGRMIPWYENLPIASYLVLHGRCRSCGVAIGWRTLAIELATPALFGGLILLWRGQDWPMASFFWALSVVSWTLVAAPVVARGRRQLGALMAWGLLLAGWGVAVLLT